MMIDRRRPGTVHIALDALALGDRPGGVGRYISHLVGGLAQRGDDTRLTVVVRDAARSSLPSLPASTIAGPGRLMSMGPLRALWEQALLPRVASARQCDLIHGLMGVVPAVADLPRVVTIHDVTFFTHPELHTRAKVAYFRAMLPRSARCSRLVITDSAASKREIATVLQLTPDAIRVVPLAVDPHFTPASPDAVAAVKRQFELDRPFILYAGVIEPRKNLPRLLAAVRTLRASGLPHQLVVAGKLGWDTAAFVDDVARSPDAARLVGYVTDCELRALLGACDAFAYVPLVEGFGLPAAEALACGAVVVTSAVSSLPEVVGDAGILVDPLDVEAIDAGLRLAIVDDTVRKRCRDKGLARARELSPEALATATRAVYDEALGLA